jgi:hypothetical protein
LYSETEDESAANRTGGYFPQVIEVGYVFRLEDFESGAWPVMGSSLMWLSRILLEAHDDAYELLQEIFQSPSGWRLPAGEVSTLTLIRPNTVSSLRKNLDYNGSPNSYVYGHLLPRLAEHKVALSTVAQVLSEADYSEAEEIIALGNLSLAHLIIGEFKEACSLAFAVIEKSLEHNSTPASEELDLEESVFIIESVYSVTLDKALLESLSTALSGMKVDIYDAPGWLVSAIESLRFKQKVAHTDSLGDAQTKQTSNSSLIGTIAKQLAELMPKIDQFDFIQFHDRDNLRPSVAVLPWGKGTVGISVSAHDESLLTSFPWLYNEEKGKTFSFEVSRRFLVDSKVNQVFLNELFDCYSEVEIELAPIGSSQPRVSTFLPVRKEVDLPSASRTSYKAPSQSGVGYYGPRLFFGITHEIGEGSLDFDWF